MDGAAPAAKTPGKEPLVSCPVCSRELPASRINLHLDRCLQGPGGGDPLPEPGGGGQSSSPAAPLQQPCKKKMRLCASPERSSCSSRGEEGKGGLSPPTPLFSLFQKGRGSGAKAPPKNAAGPGSPPRAEGEGEEEEERPGVGAKDLAQELEGKPLADKLRPDALGDYVGQERVVGEQTLLRSLLEAHEIPSLILWGPPGCGKVSVRPPCCLESCNPACYPCVHTR